MPDQHPGKRVPASGPPGQVSMHGAVHGKVRTGYAELYCKTNFSFLEGASHADELVTVAAELGLHALAVTDRETVAGVVRAHVAAKEAGLKLLIGTELTPADAGPLLLWAPDRAAYGRMVRLLTQGRRAAPKGQCHLTFADIADHADGLLAGVLLQPLALPALQMAHHESDQELHDDSLARYREVFGDRCYGLAALQRGCEDERLLQRMSALARTAGVPMVACNDVHYHVAQRRPLQDVLTAIRHRCSVAELGQRVFANAERHLKDAGAMLELFEKYPEAVRRSVEVADRCTFSLDELRYEYPEELCPPGTTPLEHLTRLTWEGARGRYPQGIPDKVRKLIEHELTLIGELRYEAYFLTVWDLVKFARGRGILCQGRGSAANSAVCYCLGVTSVDPDRIDVLFERFVSKERDEAPDIDVDFEHERREEVVQYIYQKYGRDRAGMTAEIITYRSRSAVRDVGKALGLSLDRIDVLAKATDHHHDETQLAMRFKEVGFPVQSELGRRLIELVGQILHFPRHLSQHVGGLVITHGPLCELVPIENAAMADRTVVQWDKNDLDALGILKVDCLALGMLTAIRKCFDLVASDGWMRGGGREVRGETSAGKLTLATVPAEDSAVYDRICRAETMGVFQIESRAQMSMLPRLRPRCFYDLVIEVAIVRPGPIQGDMVHPYLRRRRGDEPVEFPDERIRDVLAKTLGVPIFQEQAMRLAVVAAGFSPGEADQLRRAMGAWRRRGVMEKFQKKLIDGMRNNGYPADFADRVFRQIQGFGEYGFPESHAASFALLVYVSAWLKHYYPAAFAAALINSQPMGFYQPAQLIADARKNGVKVVGIDINFSAWDCTLERDPLGADTEEAVRSSDVPMSSHADQDQPRLRLGFRLLQGLREAEAQALVQARAAGPFLTFADFVRRCRLSRTTLKKLAQADALASLKMNRRTALWKALPEGESFPLFEGLEDEAKAAPNVANNVRDEEEFLPAMTPMQEVLADYGSAGLSLRQHPMSFLRRQLDRLGVTPAGKQPECQHNDWLRVAGIVLLRQRPSTANGITFVTLEDETGMVNLIVRKQIWERYRRVARSAQAYLAHGTLQREGEVIHVLVSKLEDLSDSLAQLQTKSRDFR